MGNFHELNVWRKMHGLVLEVYRATALFPECEKYGLVNQMRRSAVSVAANIAEGSKRRTINDRTHFHTMADGSLQELKYYFLLSRDLKFLRPDAYDRLSASGEEIGKMLNGLTKSMKSERSLPLKAES